MSLAGEAIDVPNPEKECFWLHVRGSGAQGGIRTPDTAIFSRMLYQLSYLGLSGRLVGPIKARKGLFGDRRAVGAPPYGEGSCAWQGRFQSSSPRITSLAISSGAAGRPGTA
jgi:hypothetical protein